MKNNDQPCVQEVPEVPQRLTVAGFTSRTANLTWRHPFDGKSEIISFHIEYKKAHRELLYKLHDRALFLDSSRNLINDIKYLSRNVEGGLRALLLRRLSLDGATHPPAGLGVRPPGGRRQRHWPVRTCFVHR